MEMSHVRKHAVGTLAAMLVLALAAGCKSDGSGGTEPGPTPAISIALSVSSATVPHGGVTQLTATLTRSGGFTGTVNFSVTGAPAGVTGAVGNVVDSGGTSTGSIVIQVAPAAVPGTYNISIRGSGTGVTDATATFVLTITASGFTITAQPAAISIQQGNAGNVNIAINRVGGFAASVTLVATVNAAGVTLTMNPPSTTGNTSTLSIAVAANAAPGTYTIGIGAASGVFTGSASVALTITASGGGGGGNASVNLSCFNVLWFASKDGNGPWTPVTGVNGVYSFNVTQATGGFTWVHVIGGVTQTIVQYFTRAELTASVFNFCPAAAVTKTINGTVSGLGATDNARFGLGAGGAFAGANGAFTMTNVQQGTHDFFAYRHDPARDMTGTGNPDRAVIRRDQNIPNGGSIGNVDFNAGDSFAPATSTVTVNGTAGGEVLTHGMGYYSGAACTFASFYTFAGTLPSPPAPQTFTASGIPAAMQRNTDFHQIFVTGITRPSATAPPTATRTVQELYRVLANRAITLPTMLPVPAITTLAGPYKRLQAVYTIPGDYQINTVFAYTESTVQRFASISASLGFLGGTTATLAMPDFSGLAGWNNTWPPAASSIGTWFTNANGNNLGAGGLCVENARIVGGTQLGAY